MSRLKYFKSRLPSSSDKTSLRVCMDSRRTTSEVRFALLLGFRKDEGRERIPGIRAIILFTVVDIPHTSSCDPFLHPLEHCKCLKLSDWASIKQV